jgi:hypothetical protein
LISFKFQVSGFKFKRERPWMLEGWERAFEVRGRRLEACGNSGRLRLGLNYSFRIQPQPSNILPSPLPTQPLFQPPTLRL